MFRLFGILFVGFVFGIAGINFAWADSINCIRTSSLLGAQTSDYYSQFPKQLSLDTEGWSKVSGQKSLRNGEYQLFPNGKMMFKKMWNVWGDNSAHKEPQLVFYQCDKTAVEVAMYPANLNEQSLCSNATNNGKWETSVNWKKYTQEAKRRGLSCGVVEIADTQTPSSNTTPLQNKIVINLEDYQEYRKVTYNDSVITQQTVIGYNTFVNGNTRSSRGSVFVSGEWCNTSASFDIKTKKSDFAVSCPSGYLVNGTYMPLGSGKGSIGRGKDSFGNFVQYRLHPSSGEFAISRQDFIDWERLNTQNIEVLQNISNDTQIPLISATSRRDSQTNAVISGQVTDNVAVAEVTIDGEPVRLGNDGSFITSFYVPRSGKTVEIVAFDKKGNKATKSLFIERSEVQQTTGPVFASLNPLGKRVKSNKDALALIIGVADYQRTPAKAAYADKDAQTFYDYAMLKLGISAGNIKELVNMDANEVELRLAVKDWLARSTKQGQSDIYVFFAGHGLASDDGEKMYLLPVDGEPRLLDDTAISRERLFADISAANPRSVTVFLDTCYSGTTRGTDMLIASRPIAIKALKQSVPENFTVMTAAAGDQTAKPLEEAKHGMFSYFLMKGMEGEADANNDNEITAGELHSYVETNVIQQSSGSQTPELQGDADRVLVRFQ